MSKPCFVPPPSWVRQGIAFTVSAPPPGSLFSSFFTAPRAWAGPPQTVPTGDSPLSPAFVTAGCTPPRCDTAAPGRHRIRSCSAERWTERAETTCVRTGTEQEWPPLVPRPSSCVPRPFSWRSSFRPAFCGFRPSSLFPRPAAFVPRSSDLGYVNGHATTGPSSCLFESLPSVSPCLASRDAGSCVVGCESGA